MINTLFKKIGDKVVRIMAHDYECDHLESEGWVYSAEKADVVEVKRGRKPKAVDDERGESNQASVAKDTGSGT